MSRRTFVAALLGLSVLAPALALAAERWSGDGISWQVPQGWTQRPGSSEFRFAQVDMGEELVLVVSRFPGDVGGNLANVNRWRQQLMLQPVTEAELDKVTKKVKAGDTTAILVDITNEAGDTRMLGAIIPDEKNERTWFFKATGAAKALGERAAKFEHFVGTVRLDGAK